MPWALVPVKDMVIAKTRLGGILPPSERRGLAQALLEDVVAVLNDCAAVQGVLIVSDDPAAELVAHKYGAECVSESSLGCAGLNGAVAAGRDYLADKGVADIMVLHSDIPLLQAADVEMLITRYLEGDKKVVIGTDLAGTGTNIMLMPTSPAIDLCYGEGSCQAHQRTASEQGLVAEVVARETFGLDIDHPGDLLHAYHSLQSSGMQSRTAQLLLGASVAQRLLAMEQGGLGSVAAESGVENNDSV